MSNKVTSAANQQGSLHSVSWRILDDPSETIRRAPFSHREIKAYLLGALHDGTFSANKRFRISQRGTEWLKILKDLFKISGYNAWIYREGKERSVYVIETLADFLDFNFDPLKFVLKEEKIGYIRGFFDAEGGIPRKGKDKFYVQLAQNDKEKLMKLKRILNELNIKSGEIHNPSQKVDPNYWRMYVSTGSHKKFVMKIGSWHPRKISTLRERVKIWSMPYSDIGIT